MCSRPAQGCLGRVGAKSIAADDVFEDIFSQAAFVKPVTSSQINLTEFQRGTTHPPSTVLDTLDEDVARHHLVDGVGDLSSKRVDAAHYKRSADFSDFIGNNSAAKARAHHPPFAFDPLEHEGCRHRKTERLRTEGYNLADTGQFLKQPPNVYEPLSGYTGFMPSCIPTNYDFHGGELPMDAGHHRQTMPFYPLSAHIPSPLFDSVVLPSAFNSPTASSVMIPNHQHSFDAKSGRPGAHYGNQHVDHCGGQAACSHAVRAAILESETTFLRHQLALLMQSLGGIATQLQTTQQTIGLLNMAQFSSPMTTPNAYEGSFKPFCDPTHSYMRARLQHFARPHEAAQRTAKEAAGGSTDIVCCDVDVDSSCEGSAGAAPCQGGQHSAKGSPMSSKKEDRMRRLHLTKDGRVDEGYATAERSKQTEVAVDLSKDQEKLLAEIATLDGDDLLERVKSVREAVKASIGISRLLSSEKASSRIQRTSMQQILRRALVEDYQRSGVLPDTIDAFNLLKPVQDSGFSQLFRSSPDNGSSSTEIKPSKSEACNL